MRFTASVVWTSFEIPPNSGPRYRAGLDFPDADADAGRRVLRTAQGVANAAPGNRLTFRDCDRDTVLTQLVDALGARRR